MKKSANFGLKVNVMLSPPDSIKITSKPGLSFSSFSAASMFIDGSSLTAVCGQPPVSIPTMRFGSMFLPSLAASLRASSLE